MTNSYTASLQTWEVDKEALFPPVGPTGSKQSFSLGLWWEKKSHTIILNSPLSGKCCYGLENIEASANIGKLNT